MCLLALVSSGKAAVPPAPAVTLQSVLSWIGDTLYSITNEGLYIHCSSNICCHFAQRSTKGMVDFLFSHRADLETTIPHGNSYWLGSRRGTVSRLPPASAWLSRKIRPTQGKGYLSDFWDAQFFSVYLLEVWIQRVTQRISPNIRELFTVWVRLSITYCTNVHRFGRWSHNGCYLPPIRISQF